MDAINKQNTNKQNNLITAIHHNKLITGIHHITSFGSIPKKEGGFLCGYLGVKVSKKDVINYDDTSVYHLYYGNETGSPGTLFKPPPLPLIFLSVEKGKAN